MSIIVIIITPNGDWNYGYTPTTHNTNLKVQNFALEILWKAVRPEPCDNFSIDLVHLFDIELQEQAIIFANAGWR